MTAQEYLQSQWSSLMKSAHADNDKARACFEGLVENYSIQNRYYHTLKHIEALLRQAELVKWRDRPAST